MGLLHLPTLCEAYLPYFRFVKFDYRLSNGRTVIKDIYANLNRGGQERRQGCTISGNGWGATSIAADSSTRCRIWPGSIETAHKQRGKRADCFEAVTGRKSADEMI